MIPAPNNESSKKEDNKIDPINRVDLPIDILAEVVKALHNGKFIDAKSLIHTASLNIKPSKCIDSTQEVNKKFLIITKHIKENSMLDIQISFIHSKSYSVDPTVSLIHISKTFSCCLLHVKHPIECYAPEILKSSPFHACETLSDYVKLWQPIVEAESITNSISSKRIPVIIKELRLEWTSRNEAQFEVPPDFTIKYRKPFEKGDLVCTQYCNLIPNYEKFDFKLDKNKKATLVVHGKITGLKEQIIKIKFSESTPASIKISKHFCNLEIIPIQVTFR